MARRKNHAPNFKAKVVLAVLSGNKISSVPGTFSTAVIEISITNFMLQFNY